MTRPSLLACLFSALLFCAACSGQPGMSQPLQDIVEIKDGKIFCADGRNVAIPHYADSSYIILFCVRHCEKAKDGTKDPDLTAEGQARASRLGRILSGVSLDRICSTPYKRTVQTAEAIKDKSPANPGHETYPPDSQDVWLQSLLDGGGGKRYAVVGHSNTIPQLLNRLLDKAVAYQNIPDEEYGRIYVVATKGYGQTVVLEGRY